EVEAREIRERIERRGGRIVEALDVPETEASKVVERGKRLHAVGGDRRAAHVETAQLFQRRERCEPEIGDAGAAGDSALRLAVDRAEIGRTRGAERDAEPDVQLLEPAEERDRLQLEIGDDRRPTPSGVAALDAVEAERSQLRQQ